MTQTMAEYCAELRKAYRREYMRVYMQRRRGSQPRPARPATARYQARKRAAFAALLAKVNE